MLTLLKKLVISDPVSGDSVTLSNITEGVDGATSFFYNEEASYLKIEDAQSYKDKIMHSIDIRVLREIKSDPNETTNYDILSGWAENQTEVRAGAIGIDGVLIWEGLTLLRINQQMSGNDVLALYLSKGAVPGYNFGSGGYGTDLWYSGKMNGEVFAGKNALMLYDVEKNRGDNPTSQTGGYYLSGFENDGGSAVYAEFISAGGYQYLEKLASTEAGAKSELLFLPFPGTVLTISLDVQEITGGAWSLEVDYFDSVQNSIGTTLIVPLSEGSRNSTIATIPTGGQYVRLRVVSNVDNAIIRYKEPAIRIDGKTNFTRW